MQKGPVERHGLEITRILPEIYIGKEESGSGDAARKIPHRIWQEKQQRCEVRENYDHHERWDDPPDSPHIKSAYRVALIIDVLDQLTHDDESRNYKEDINTDVSARER